MTLTGGAVVSLLLHQPTFLVLGSIGALGTLATALWPRLRRRVRRRADGERAHAPPSWPSPPISRPTRRPSRRACGPRRSSSRPPWPALTSPGRSYGRARADEPWAFAAVVGRGDRWQPPALATGSVAVPDEWWALVETAGALHDVPVAVDLGPGAVVGVVGPPAVARPLAGGAWSCSWSSPTARPTSWWPP